MLYEQLLGNGTLMTVFTVGKGFHLKVAHPFADVGYEWYFDDAGEAMRSALQHEDLYGVTEIG